MFYKYLKFFLFLTVLIEASAEEFDSKNYATKSIQNNCKKKWRTDYRMFRHCIEKQTNSYNYVKNKSSSIITNTIPFQIIRMNCKKKWETDYSMVEYCVKKQTDSYKYVKYKNNGVLTQKCKKKWETDYSMVEYCVKKEEAKNPHINNTSSFGDNGFAEKALLQKMKLSTHNTSSNKDNSQCKYYINRGNSYYRMSYSYHKANNITEKQKFLNFAIRAFKKAQKLCNKKSTLETLQKVLSEVKSHL